MFNDVFCGCADNEQAIGEVYSRLVSTSDEKENTILSIVEHAFRDVLKKKVGVRGD